MAKRGHSTDPLPPLLVHVVQGLGKCENPGVPVLFGRHNLPPLVEIGLTDLPKSGGAMTQERTKGLYKHGFFGYYF